MCVHFQKSSDYDVVCPGSGTPCYTTYPVPLLLSLIHILKNFAVRAPAYELKCGPYHSINYKDFPKDTIFYFDPPYFITNAEYNDGKRGLEGWNANNEVELLAYLKEIDEAGYKFMLSNVVRHKGKEHHILLDWIQAHDYNMIEIGKTGIKYPREEVVVTNYDIFE